MLTPVQQLRSTIEARHALAVQQRARAGQQFWALRETWYSTLGRPRNLMLGLGAGFSYGMLRRSQVKVPGRVDLWRLARPLLVSSVAAWWAQRQARRQAALP